MLLAGDIGGTKTFIGLFDRATPRPAAIDTRSYRTPDFADLTAIARQFLKDSGRTVRDIESACFAVAGPVVGRRARLTNVPWTVDADAICRDLPVPQSHLINDLEALAWSVPLLGSDEIETLRKGEPDPNGGVALMAAGTGLGVALLPKIDGRFVPLPSEGGHVDFAGRTPEEHILQTALIKEYGRAELERVVSGMGLWNIHRFVYPHRCATLTQPALDQFPALITRAAIEGGCAECRRTLELFVSAYGAAAGDLALTALARGGIYLGGGIAPRVLPALRWPAFEEAFCSKTPLDGLMRRIPVKVILNPAAGLMGAAAFAKVFS